jgi:AraC-like DNA-binding protein
MSLETRPSRRVALRPDYGLEHGRGELAREPSIELDLAAFFVLSGRCQVSIGDARARLEGPAVALVNPGTAFGVTADPDGGGAVGEHLLVSLEQPAADRVAVALGLDERAVVVFARTFAALGGTLELSARRLAIELDAAMPGRETALDLAAELLAFDLLRAHARADRSSRLERSRAGLVDRRLRRAVEFMHDNYARDLALGEIAAAAYLSEFHFARLFKRLTGHTPHAYLASLRLAHARRLLATTDSSVAEVGAHVGYHSASHFTKVFRTAVGLTPSAFRDALLK